MRGRILFLHTHAAIYYAVADLPLWLRHRLGFFPFCCGQIGLPSPCWVGPPSPVPNGNLMLLLPCLGIENLYQAANNWWDKKATRIQLASFPLGPSTNFSCKIQGTGSCSQIDEFASALFLSKASTPLGFHIPSTESG